jgi:hypothetical protein
VRPQFGVEIQAQIDAWTLAAWKRMVILQRPGEVPVTIRAQGSAVWAAAGGSGERREDTLDSAEPAGTDAPMWRGARSLAQAALRLSPSPAAVCSARISRRPRSLRSRTRIVDRSAP